MADIYYPVMTVIPNEGATINVATGSTFSPNRNKRVIYTIKEGYRFVGHPKMTREIINTSTGLPETETLYFKTRSETEEQLDFNTLEYDATFSCETESTAPSTKYTATVEENAHASINITTGQEFDEDSNIDLKYVASEGWKFSEPPVLTYQEFNPMTGSMSTVTEEFTQVSETEYTHTYNVWADFTVSCVTEESAVPVTEYTATVEEDPNATLNITNGQKFAEDSTINLIYKTKEGWKFSEPPTLSYEEFNPMMGTTTTVTENFVKASDTEYHYEYNVWADFTVSCVTEELPPPVVKYTATVPQDSNVTINLTNGQEIEDGTSLTINCDVNEGYEFVETPIITYQQFNPSSMTMETITEPFNKNSETSYTKVHTVESDFEVKYTSQMIPPPPEKVSISLEMTNATSNISEGQQFDKGTVVDITVTAHNNFEFKVAPRLQRYDPSSATMEYKEMTMISETEYQLSLALEYDWTIKADAVPVTVISEGYGIITVFNPTVKQLKELSKKRFIGAESHEVDVGKYIVDLYKIFVPVVTGAESKIYLGKFDTGVTAKTVTDDVVTFDCGSVTITGHYQNRSDYNSEIELYLPFVGKQKLDTDKVMDRTISLTYKVNTLNGDVMAIVTTNDGYTERYEGKCRMTVPYILMENNVRGNLNIESDFMVNEPPTLTVIYHRNMNIPSVNQNNDTGRIGDKPTGFTRLTNVKLADTTANITEQRFIIEALENGVIL